LEHFLKRKSAPSQSHKYCTKKRFVVVHLSVTQRIVPLNLGRYIDFSRLTLFTGLRD
jgi:hypothetical protein